MNLQLHSINRDLCVEINKLQRKFQQGLSSNSMDLCVSQNLEMADLVKSCNIDVESAFPDTICYQRFFDKNNSKQLK